jgi:hypothetical protein
LELVFKNWLLSALKVRGQQMNSKGNKVILILVVGLAAFSSAMRELNEVRKFGLEVNQFVAQWSEKLAPAEIPAAPVVAKVQTCQSKHSEVAVELPWMENVAQQDETADIEEPEAPAPPVVKREATKVKKAHRADVDPKEFEVRILNDRDGDQDVPAVYELQQPPSASTFKFRTHKFNFNKLSPRDREMLKTLNRSINLRIAS